MQITNVVSPLFHIVISIIVICWKYILHVAILWRLDLVMFNMGLLICTLCTVLKTDVQWYNVLCTVCYVCIPYTWIAQLGVWGYNVPTRPPPLLKPARYRGTLQYWLGSSTSVEILFPASVATDVPTEKARMSQVGVQTVPLAALLCTPLSKWWRRRCTCRCRSLYSSNW